jgi:hypothetical protein
LPHGGGFVGDRLKTFPNGRFFPRALRDVRFKLPRDPARFPGSPISEFHLGAQTPEMRSYVCMGSVRTLPAWC